jgi:hypothetical protein
VLGSAWEAHEIIEIVEDSRAKGNSHVEISNEVEVDDNNCNGNDVVDLNSHKCLELTIAQKIQVLDKYLEFLNDSATQYEKSATVKWVQNEMNQPSFSHQSLKYMLNNENKIWNATM